MSLSEVLFNKLSYEVTMRDVLATNKHAKVGPFIVALYQFSKVSTTLFKGMPNPKSEFRPKACHYEKGDEAKWKVVVDLKAANYSIE